MAGEGRRSRLWGRGFDLPPIVKLGTEKEFDEGIENPPEDWEVKEADDSSKYLVNEKEN